MALQKFVANELLSSAKLNGMVDAINDLDAKIEYYRQLLDTKQDALISGKNIKTVNYKSILGSGNLAIGESGTIQTKDNYLYVMVTKVNNQWKCKLYAVNDVNVPVTVKMNCEINLGDRTSVKTHSLTILTGKYSAEESLEGMPFDVDQTIYFNNGDEYIYNYRLMGYTVGTKYSNFYDYNLNQFLFDNGSGNTSNSVETNNTVYKVWLVYDKSTNEIAIETDAPSTSSVVAKVSYRTPAGVLTEKDITTSSVVEIKTPSNIGELPIIISVSGNGVSVAAMQYNIETSGGSVPCYVWTISKGQYTYNDLFGSTSGGSSDDSTDTPSAELDNKLCYIIYTEGTSNNTIQVKTEVAVAKNTTFSLKSSSGKINTSVTISSGNTTSNVANVDKISTSTHIPFLESNPNDGVNIYSNSIFSISSGTSSCLSSLYHSDMTKWTYNELFGVAEKQSINLYIACDPKGDNVNDYVVMADKNVTSNVVLYMTYYNSDTMTRKQITIASGTNKATETLRSCQKPEYAFNLPSIEFENGDSYEDSSSKYDISYYNVTGVEAVMFSYKYGKTQFTADEINNYCLYNASDTTDHNFPNIP